MHCQLIIMKNIANFVFFVVECVINQNSEQSNDEKTRMDLIIPLVIFTLCFLLSLGVNIYQRRLIQNNARQPGHQRGKSEQNEKFGM